MSKNGKKKMTKRPQHNISNEKFVEIWQSSPLFENVCKKLKVDARYASARATSLRKRKVQLKHFKRPADFFDVKALNALAKKYLLRN